jgi:hypothetical protein
MFGLESLANILFEKKWYADEYNSTDKIYKWLKWWEANARR